jgi:DNA-binding CsgD family transcriptional regulator/tetratricopeptide (TPR) repeat protein
MELIERAEVLTSLQKAFKNVTEGEGHCLFISGEAGIGKTSLVKAFCIEQDDCVIYQGACDALFTPRPLAPLYDIVWQVRSDLWPTSHTIEERSELFLKFFHELSLQKQKILIVFEDIHWADEATLDFIKFFARRVTKLKCLFILTYRDDEINASYLSNILGDLSPQTFTRVQLRPLSKEAVYKMAGQKGYDAANVYNISGGNPFYVTEILASYSPGVPENIKDAILAVYNRQEKGTKNAWEICSVIPEGLEVNRFAKIKSSWDEGMDHCFALNIILIKNDRVVFKHELYRRTIEASLSPFKRIELNKKILELFLHSFEEQKEIERIVHYATNANENKLVNKYAPIAAKEAAGVGAHIEAAKLFLTAIEYSDGNDTENLVALYEAYAYECYLTNQTIEAIIYYNKALELWKQKGNIEKVGSCLYSLSRLWWINDNLKKAEDFAAQSIEVLDNRPSSGAKAMAYSLMSQLKMLSDDSEQCIAWGEKAIQLATEVSDNAILSYALGNVGSVQIRMPSLQQNGLVMLQQSLQIALQNSYHDYAGMAYVNLAHNGIIVKDYVLAANTLSGGLSYCEENNLDLWRLYLLTLQAKLKLETGDWTIAYAIAHKLVEDKKAAKIIKIFALTILATIEMRRGDGSDILSRLTEAKEKALETMEPQRIIQAMTAFLEYEWITGHLYIQKEVLESTIQMTATRGNIYGNSEFAFWLQKARGAILPLKELYNGYNIGNAATAKQASAIWEQAGNPYNRALSLFEGNEDDKRKAIVIVQDLGADAVYQKMKLDMRSSGIKKIPRGLRESTKTNPAGLTNRELDVLQLLQKGIQNKEIAGTLFISPKTADHHISSILFKLDVNSRSKAVNEAVRLGILK